MLATNSLPLGSIRAMGGGPTTRPKDRFYWHHKAKRELAKAHKEGKLDLDRPKLKVPRGPESKRLRGTQKIVETLRVKMVKTQEYKDFKARRGLAPLQAFLQVGKQRSLRPSGNSQQLAGGQQQVTKPPTSNVQRKGLQEPSKNPKSQTLVNAGQKPGRIKDTQTAEKRGIKAPTKIPEFKHLKMARSLAVVPGAQKLKVRKHLSEHGEESFIDYPLLPTINQALDEIFSDLKNVGPTPIQRLAIPALLNLDPSQSPRKEPSAFMMAAETGSGKTLAYLIPVIQHMKQEEACEAKQKAAEDEAKAAEKTALSIDPSEIDPGVSRPRPKVVILLPTAELVTQVGRIVKKFSHVVKFRAILLSRDFGHIIVKNRLNSKPDLIISTPHILSSIAQAEPDILSRCHYMVVDEVDTLFDRSFREITQSILERSSNLKQIVLCSATIPKSLEDLIRKSYPTISRLVTPNIHAIPRRVTLSLVDIDGDPYKGNKDLACADCLYEIANEPHEVGFVKKVVVFVNSRDTLTPLTSYLKSKHIDAVEFGRDSIGRSGSEIMDYFTGPQVQAPLDEYEGGPKTVLKKMKVLVTTDISSRGIDTKQVRNVVLYDVPFSTVDFVHRLGRVGRMGRRGRATVLVDKQTNKAWIKEIKKCMFMGQALI